MSPGKTSPAISVLTSTSFWAYVLTADMNFGQQVVEETEETILFKDGNGALLRKHKLHDSTPEHVAFDVEDADGYYKKSAIY